MKLPENPYNIKGSIVALSKQRAWHKCEQEYLKLFLPILKGRLNLCVSVDNCNPKKCPNTLGDNCESNKLSRLIKDIENKLSSNNQ